ncbi:Sel1 repeat protein [Beggiatoa alba B18LD]|uniref:Sel1 repeat protein n=1 Tax=Beggiatoa alba B18LD TaxID=395493 RepID=I3CIJ6_9GAMM|nr:tetratricopeptide repeat protein [Beggiatoa alba]EIJ43439.1 Sel1 repeat protein [Beggiatoa alba B18LD]
MNNMNKLMIHCVSATLLSFYSVNSYAQTETDPAKRGLLATYAYQAFKSGDYAQAIEVWSQLAETNHIPSLLLLGMLYEEGLGVPQDIQIAVAWYQKAAELGDAITQYNLGVMYAQGRPNLPPDLNLARHWLNIAARQGDADAIKALQELIAGKPVTSIVTPREFPSFPTHLEVVAPRR